MGTPFAQFGNLQYTAGWELNYQSGPEPSVCTILTVPHLDYLEQYSDLVIGDTDSGSLTIRDCVLESPAFTEDRKWSLPILDRRWKWRFGKISGVYNKRKPDEFGNDTFIREKSPQELAGILLRAMGETQGNWDIGRLPNYARPFVEWDNDNPASMLDELITSLGCMWTLDYFQNRVVVWPIGEGDALPEGPTESRMVGFYKPAPPDSIEIFGAKTIFQARFSTEAVGKDTDGKWKRLGELSYKPLDDPEPDSFSNIEGTYDDHGETKEKRDLATSTCFRTYRVTGLANGGWSPELLKSMDLAPQSFDDIELLDSQARQYIDAEGRKQNLPPHVEAKWYDSETDEIPDFAKPYKGHVTVDGKLGLIRFADPLYLRDDNDEKVKAAEVYVDVAFHAGRDGIFHRPSRMASTGVAASNHGTGPEIITRDEIQLRFIQHYSQKQISAVESLPSDVNQQLDYWSANNAKYAEQPSATRTYHGLLPITPNGRVRQVTWSGGGGSPARTQASMQTEHNPFIPSIEDNRRKRTLNDQLKKSKSPEKAKK